MLRKTISYSMRLAMILQFALSMQRVGVSRPQNAPHDCDRVLEPLKRLALFIGGGVSV